MTFKFSSQVALTSRMYKISINMIIIIGFSAWWNQSRPSHDDFGIPKSLAIGRSYANLPIGGGPLWWNSYGSCVKIVQNQPAKIFVCKKEMCGESLFQKDKIHRYPLWMTKPVLNFVFLCILLNLKGPKKAHFKILILIQQNKHNLVIAGHIWECW